MRLESQLTVIEKLWSHQLTKGIQSRKDLLYAFRRRHSDPARVDWAETIPARIADVRMWDLQMDSTGIGWDKYGLRPPRVYMEDLIGYGILKETNEGK